MTVRSIITIPVRFCRGFATGLIACLGTTGCFFTSGVNSEPQAQIETVAAGPYHRGATIALTAYKSDDPNGDRLQVDWQAYTCSADRTQCDVPAFAELADVDPDEQFAFTVPARRLGADEPTVIVSVAATVTDEHGATHEDRLFVDISNRAPTAMLQVQGVRTAPGENAYPIGSYVRVLADNQDPDGDGVSYTWNYLAPIDSDPSQVGWRMLDAATYELEPDVAGLWMVEVTATDELGEATTKSASIDMRPDALPCIASIDPPYAADARYIVDRDGPTRRFAVLEVRDDLDAYPPRTDEPFFESARFRWLQATPATGGALTELANHRESDLVLDPGVFVPGDRVSLRVEIDDRAGRDIVCGVDSPTCSLAGDACLQRITWEIEIR